MKDNESILLCWHSANHGLPVLENAIRALRNRKVTVQKVIYLLQPNQSQPPAAIEGASVEPISLPVQDPTLHEAIYQIMKTEVLPRLKHVSELHVNVSPGTPAMHAVWMVLHAGGAFPEGTRLWSSQFNPQTGRTRIDEVDFSISTYLSEIRQQARVKPELAVYEPEAKSEARRAAFERLRRYAAIHGAPLLLLGERGTGKTRLVETFVAKLKQRRTIVTVPCGGLDSTLAESALFGHRKGAFTGAVTDRAGFLKQADGGILFLDEVQDMPQTAQRKLVRTLQDRSRRFRPAGSDAEVTVDFELVCASNLTLEGLRERLDADLFDRLSHLTITVPPLRDCREDLHEDWQRVWAEMRADARTNSEAPWSDQMEKAFRRHVWAGNLREMQRLALLIMAWSDGEAGERAIESALSEWSSHSMEVSAEPGPFGEGTRSERVNWFCGRLAAWAREHHGGWKAAAKALGCDEKTLRTDLARQGRRA
jgi:DNA-binding NtrC family response regulator